MTTCSLFIFQHGMTALIWASGRGHTEVVNHLLVAGANPDAADKVRWEGFSWSRDRKLRGMNFISFHLHRFSF